MHLFQRNKNSIARRIGPGKIYQEENLGLICGYPVVATTGDLGLIYEYYWRDYQKENLGLICGCLMMNTMGETMTMMHVMTKTTGRPCMNPIDDTTNSIIDSCLDISAYESTIDKPDIIEATMDFNRWKMATIATMVRKYNGRHRHEPITSRASMREDCIYFEEGSWNSISNGRGVQPIKITRSHLASTNHLDYLGSLVT